MTLNLLSDIYGVHKALVFGQLQREDYSINDFLQNIKTAEMNVFENDICSRAISNDDPRFALSFYPKYLIDDDIFGVMACHYAVSSVLNGMVKELNDDESLHILSVVVPAAVNSRYNLDVQYNPTMDDVEKYVQRQTASGVCAYQSIHVDIDKVPMIAKAIRTLITQLNLHGGSRKSIVILFNRQTATLRSPIMITVLECDYLSKLKELYRNYFVSFEFDVSGPANAERNSGTESTVRSWLHFGVGQRLRYYPEYAVWIIPNLFVRSTKMTAYKFLERIYSDDYKHGWRVSLEDPVFNKYYHIITQHEHVSNNYNRSEVEAKHKDVQRLLRDHLEEKLKGNVAFKLKQYTEGQSYDSDAILQDSNDANESNIACFSSLDEREFRRLKFTVLKFQNMECTADSVRSLADCEHIDILIENLREFQDCGLVIDALNVIQFDVDSIIAAFDHIVKVHGFLNANSVKLKIQNFIKKRLWCRNGADCAVMTQHSNRTRERQSTEEKRADTNHEVDTLCEVTADALNAVHCYLLHRDSHLYRLMSDRNDESAARFSTAVNDDDAKGDNQKLNVKTAKLRRAKSLRINFGLSVLRWLPFGEEPEFQTLGEEILKNPMSTIDEALFQQYLMICYAKIKETNYTLNEMMCLKLYTDTNEMQSQLRKAHWTTTLLEVRKAYYQWAMGLYRTHLYHAVPIPTAPGSKSKPCRLYHGLSQLFTVNSDLPVYYGPISTTVAVNVATKFSGEQGLMWLIQPSYANPLKIVVGINVDWVSVFKHEREVLLYNQCLPIQETESFDDDPNTLMNHFIHSLISRESPILKKDTFYKQLGVSMNESWIHYLCDHELIFEMTKCNGMSVIERLALEFNVLAPKLLVKLLTAQHGDKASLEYLVEDMGAIGLSDHYRVITSKFEIETYSKMLNCSWLKLRENTKMDHKFAINEVLDNQCFDKTDYRINGMIVPFATLKFDGLIQMITIKNEGLFGDHEVILQQFETKKQQNLKIQKPFSDLLSIAESGAISVQLTADRNVKVEYEGNWISGVVCETTADEICVKYDADNLFPFESFNWMKRDRISYGISSKIELIPFETEREISEIDFAARAGPKHDVDNLSNLKRFTFDDVNKFRIQPKTLVSTAITADAIHIYGKPKGKDLEYHYIKTIEHQFGSWFFSRYSFAQKHPICINERVKAQPYSESLQCSGKFEVRTSSGIIIGKRGVINASWLGLTKHSEHSNEQILKIGTFIGGSNSDDHTDGAGGGIISLVAGGNVVNEGALLCRATDHKLFGGGSIYIATDGVFENNGKIDCGKNGMVLIECARFVNNGDISAIPEVVMRTRESVDVLYRHEIVNGKEELIKLEVVSQRGHYEDKHIENVLDDKGTGSLYNSYLQGPPEEDWFIFRVKSGRRIIPKSIWIVNRDSDAAVKRISIAGSDGEGHTEFMDWIQISDIPKRTPKKVRSKFPVDTAASYFAWQRGFKSFRINVVENHGMDLNILHEFRIYGIYCE